MSTSGTHSESDDSRVERPPLIIRSDAEFETLMTEIDNEMIEEGVNIPARPIVAGLKVTSRYDIVLNAVPGDTHIQPGVFTPEQISLRIHDWIARRYGERLKMSWDVGRTVIPLRGSIYVVRCPLVMGSVRFICDPPSFGQQRPTLGVREVPTCNVLDLLECCTSELALSLSAEEVVKIGLVHSSAMAAYIVLDTVKDVTLVQEAIGDLDAAITHLTVPSQQTGLSKWSSLQAAEKLFKAFVASRGDAFSRTHDLSKLASHAERLGMAETPKLYINDLQCPAGVRYGEPPVTERDAVLAHHISLEICEVAGRTIGLALGREMPRTPMPTIDGMPAHEFLVRHSTTSEPQSDLH